MSRFTVDFRSRFPNKMRERYRSYWHKMHPLTFDPHDLFILSWTPEEWDAIQLLSKKAEGLGRWEHIFNITWSWNYDFDFSDLEDRPSYAPKKGRVTFSHDHEGGGYPRSSLNEQNLPDRLRDSMRAWLIEGYKYKAEQQRLTKCLNNLMQLEYQGRGGYGQGIYTAPVNTTGQLIRLWPELHPYLPGVNKDHIHDAKNKSPLPKGWTQETYKEFREQEGFEELNHALSVMSLLTDDTIDNYPQF